MKALVVSVLMLIFALAAVPQTFGQDVVKKVRIVCAWKTGEDVKIVPIPDKEEVFALCEQAGGTVIIYEVDPS